MKALFPEMPEKHNRIYKKNKMRLRNTNAPETPIF